MPRRYPSTLLRPLLAPLAVVALALALGSCGSDDDVEPVAPRPAETREPLPELPGGWSVHRNRAAGFAVGVPPDWRARREGIRSTFRSPDRLAAVTIFADRTREALELPLDQFAVTAITSTAGFRGLEPGEVRPFRHRYDAVAVEATGVAEDRGVRQHLLLVVLRRPELANFTVLAARNAERDTGRYVAEIERMIRSLRSRAVT